MSDQPPPHPRPGELDAIWHAWLAQQTGAATAYLQAVPSWRPLTGPEIGDVLTSCDQVREGLRDGVPAARALTRLGLRQFARDLESAHQDNRVATRAYLDLLERTAAASGGSGPDPGSEVAAGVLDRARIVVDDARAERCFDCHRPIGVAGGGYCVDDARARGLLV